MPQISRLLSALAGLLIGAALGGAGVYAVWRYYPQVSDSPTASLLSIVIVGGAPTILGGYLALMLAVKAQKKKRAKGQRGHAQFQFTPRKKRSKHR